MKLETLYFSEPGKENTNETLRVVKEYTDSHPEIRKIVIATTTGATARLAMEVFSGTGVTIVFVPHQQGFRDNIEFDDKLAGEIEAKGHIFQAGTMLFHTENFYGSKMPTSMANLLRIFGQGTKVAVEIILLACDGYRLGWKEKTVAIAGSRFGADTAVVATAAPSCRIEDLKIHCFLCKPYL